jgi:hypothetical protein
MVYAPLGEGVRTKAGFFTPNQKGGNLFGETMVFIVYTPLGSVTKQ